MSILMKNWLLGSGSSSSSGGGDGKCFGSENSSSSGGGQTQSENCLALSDDFSEKDEIIAFQGGGNVPKAFTKSIQSSSEDSIEAENFDTSQDSIYSPAFSYPRLSWQGRYLILPTYTFIFLALMPFIQGCLYTVGYRVGTRILKMVVNTKFK